MSQRKEENKSIEHKTVTYPVNNETGKDNDNNETDNSCKFEDGTYCVSVDYNNPETGYSATYTLEVEVQDESKQHGSSCWGRVAKMEGGRKQFFNLNYYHNMQG